MQTTRPVKAPRKQRKLLYNAPAHLRHKLMAAPLSPELASKSIKTLPVRKGDSIRIMRGDHKGFEGKIQRVDLKNYRIYVEGLTREKVDGTTVFVSVHPSKVTIKKLNLDDKWRKAIFERKKGLPKKEEKAAEKPPKRVAEVKEEKPAVVEKPAEKKPKVAKKRVQKKPAAKKEKEKKPIEEEKPAKKEAKPKAVKRTRVKRKTASEKEGGT